MGRPPMDSMTILWTVGLEETEKSQCSASAAKFVDICCNKLGTLPLSVTGEFLLVHGEDSGTCG